jgi:hypothetical protein
MSEKAYYASEIVFALAIVLVATSMAGCDVIGGIFKAGIWVGVIIVAVIVAVIAGIARMMRK